MYSRDRKRRFSYCDISSSRSEAEHESMVSFEQATRIASSITPGMQENGIKRHLVCVARKEVWVSRWENVLTVRRNLRHVERFERTTVW